MSRWPRLLLLSISLLSSATHATEKLFLTGAEVTSDSSQYLYIGTAIPLPESTLAKGYVLHLWTDYQTYSYEAAATDIDVTINSVSAALGYHDSGIDYWWNTRIGIVQSKGRLTPNDPGNSSSGSDANLKIQLEGEKRYSADFKLNGNLEYILGRRAYWSRVRFLTKNDDNTYDGPEFVYQGDPSYSAMQLGWVLTEMPLSNDWNMAVKAGFRFDDGNVSEYAGIELSVLY